MFKVESSPNLIDINKNKERYIFHPRERFSKTLHGSFPGKLSSGDLTKRTNEKINFNENSKIFNKENSYYKLNRVPPAIFYRKIQTPYKYNILSIPEYLVKTDEEKHFMEKLNQLINEEDKKTLNNLIKNNDKERKIKDRYKPSTLNIQNLLRYKPQLYSNSFNFMKRSNSVIVKDNNSIFSNSFNNKLIDEKENNDTNNENIIKNNKLKNEINIDKKEVIEKHENKEKKEISEEDQINYKYKLSDIYNFRNEKIFTKKSAEKYFFKDNEKKNIKPDENEFYTTNKSQSDWIPNRTIGKKMNSFSSVSYNILSPLHKGYNKFISPSELNKNNLYNECSAFHRVKSISEFIDLTRVSASNTLNCFNKNKKQLPNFKFKASVATNQLDEYHINRDLIEKPI